MMSVVPLFPLLFIIYFDSPILCRFSYKIANVWRNAAFSASATPSTVSYTHLDVYKRQMYTVSTSRKHQSLERIRISRINACEYSESTLLSLHPKDRKSQYLHFLAQNGTWRYNPSLFVVIIFQYRSKCLLDVYKRQTTYSKVIHQPINQPKISPSPT